MKWSHFLALYLFWPAVALVVWGELTPHPPDVAPGVSDKFLHFIAYFGLSGLATVALGGRRVAVWAILGLIAMGGFLEIAQAYTGRDAEVMDAVANGIGAGLGGLIGLVFVMLLSPRPLVGGHTPE